jgi:hypothetical protein
MASDIPTFPVTGVWMPPYSTPNRFAMDTAQLDWLGLSDTTK